jgi:hypothetical protein
MDGVYDISVRKIVAGLFISLDGPIEAAGQWFSLQLGQAVGSVVAAPLTVRYSS